MKNKLLSTLLFSLLVIMISCLVFIGFNENTKTAKAQVSTDNPSYYLTTWNAVNISFSELLSSGWKIIAQSSHRVATVTTNGVGAIDERSYAFTLSKGNKYINCLITNPKVNQGGYSGCRAMN
jgi:hypothetical protein